MSVIRILADAVEYNNFVFDCVYCDSCEFCSAQAHTEFSYSICCLTDGSYYKNWTDIINTKIYNCNLKQRLIFNEYAEKKTLLTEAALRTAFLSQM